MFAQIPGATEAIESASQHSWEAMALVFVLTSAIGLLGWMVKGLSARQATLESDIMQKLFVTVEASTSALAANTEASRATIVVLEKLEATVERSLVEQQRLHSKWENSPCLARKYFSEETIRRLDDLEKQGE